MASLDPLGAIGEDRLAGAPGSTGVEDVDAMALYRDIVKTYSLLSREEEVTLARAAQRGDAGARDHLVLANLRLVISLARRYMSTGMDLLDLIQEGTVGLIIAADRFDPDRGYKFSTYATWWIRKTLFQAAADKARTIRVPLHRVMELNRVIRAARALRAAKGRDPTLAEIATDIGLTPTSVAELLRVDRMTVSLDGLISSSTEQTLAGRIADRTLAGPEDVAAETMTATALRQVIRQLDPALRDIIVKRYGLVDGDDRSVGDVAEELGLSRTEARQREAEALDLLSRVPAAQALREANSVKRKG